ncbi:MAG: hypothetical protein R2783_05390 [Gelidibacter sp.]
MKSLISFFISCLPVNALRVLLLRTFLGYGIDYGSKIGMLNIINCSSLKMRNAKIGFLNQIIVEDLILSEKASIKKRNRLKYLNKLHLGYNAEIRSGNFIGAPIKGTVDAAIHFEKQNIFVGKNSSVLRNNYFDVVEEVHIGENVVFGGNGSEIWTHGFDVNRKMLVGKVIFGDNIFIGSNCVFTKNVEVVGNTSIGPLSVIYKSITEPGVYSTHEIRKIK